MSDAIRLLGLVATGHHGVFDHEKRDGQRFVVDVELALDTRAAAASDALADTVDYGALASRVVALVSGPPVDLVETLADRIALACLDDARVLAATAIVHKPQAPVGVPFGDVQVVVRRTRSLDRPPEERVVAVVALGANLGEREATLRSAVAAMASVPGVVAVDVSPVVESDPVGGVPQPAYLNAVARVETTLSARRLLAACQAVESSHGRVRDSRWGARVLDLDLVTYGDTEASDDDLVLPHPRAASRAFVLSPWLALDSQAVLPGIGAVADLLATASDAAGVRPRPDVELAR